MKLVKCLNDQRKRAEEQQDLKWSELDKSHSLHKDKNAHVVIIPSLWDYCLLSSPRTPPSPPDARGSQTGRQCCNPGLMKGLASPDTHFQEADQRGCGREPVLLLGGFSLKRFFLKQTSCSQAWGTEF